MDLSPKFIKVLSPEECLSNEMLLPHEFCSKYGSVIPIGIKMRVRNDYQIWLDYVKINQRFFGMKSFFKDFNLRGGESLLFDYVGEFKFNVLIFDISGSEIEYPLVMHESQDCWARHVVYPDDGLSFVNYVRPSGNVVDVVVPPFYFIENISPMVPDRVEYVVSSGQHIIGSYCHREFEFSGFASICHMLGIRNLNSLNYLVFSYDGRDTFKVVVFDNSMLEVPVSPNVPRNVSNDIAFEVLVQPSHMLEYCHGVDLSVKLRNITDLWNTKDSFTAYHKNRCWRLQIKKRRDVKRAAIHEGWIQFRGDMEFSSGDVCVFRWKNDNIHNFNVRIVKKARTVS
ncbi:hypothetical protein POM88_007257 [Heracleum sosnowskyi]|uniref:TF-B3 domain-containing protein n=1 Tax=Heracleum sosnowskyi TaxID=360622 RepID=A0AAD8J5S9_9APIA|nr:hypothetical protein POM88_007257 [Heracleum sosnowskyi]